MCPAGESVLAECHSSDVVASSKVGLVMGRGGETIREVRYRVLPQL